MYAYNDKMNKWLYSFEFGYPMIVEQNSPLYPLIHGEFYEINDCIFILRNKNDLKKMKTFFSF